MKPIGKRLVGLMPIPDPPSSAPSAPSAPNRPYAPLGADREPSAPSAPRGDEEKPKRGGSSDAARKRLGQAQVNVSIGEEVVSEIKAYARMARRGLAEVIEQALVDFLHHNDTRSAPSFPSAPSAPRGVSMMTDDVVLKTLNIINHQFSEFVGRSLAPAEIEACREFVVQSENPITEAEVRAGMAITLLRTKHPKVNSVKYFFGAIREVADSPGNHADYAEYMVMKLRRVRAGN